MGLSSRAPAPAPLNTTASSGQPTASPTTYENTLQSAGTEASEASSFAPTYGRKDSAKSTSSMNNTVSRPGMSGSSRRATVPVVNRYTHCGRHSDQYLFGGWGDLVKGVFRKKH